MERNSYDMLPEAFVSRMRNMLQADSEAEDFLESYHRKKIQALRVNTLKIGREAFIGLSPFELKRVPWAENGFYYSGNDSVRPGKHPYHDAGLYYIQEPSAMAVAELSGTKPGECVLDLCAAPGGKTTQLACMLQGKGLLVANEIHPTRARILSQNVERMGIRNAVVTNENPQALASFFPSFFDRIIVDAPCSGEGMFLKEEQAQLQWSPENVLMCANRQTEILESAYTMLKRGGTLVYSTCTFSAEENEGTISTFLDRHTDISVACVDAYEGFAPGRPEWGSFEHHLEHTFRLWPHRLEGEGHFVAILKKDGEDEGEYGRGKLPRVERNALKLFETFAEENQIEPGVGEYLLFGEQLYRIPFALPLKGLHVLRPGLHLGTLSKNRFEPSHAFALASSAESFLHKISFSATSDEIAAYLRGESISCSAENGWNLVLVDGYSIGLGKYSSGLLKNHYPKGLRHT